MTDTENLQEKFKKNLNLSIAASTSTTNPIRSFSCGICFELFTKEQRYPISLNCGHTFCLICIKRLSRRKSSIMCGMCRKHTFSTYKRLGKNFLLLEILEKINLLEKDKEEVEENPIVLQNLANNDEDNNSTNSGLSSSPTNEFGNSLWVSNIEFEELYDTLERIQELNFTLYNPSAHFQSAEADNYGHQLSRLRTELFEIEQNLKLTRRNFYLVVDKASELISNVRTATSNITIEPAPTHLGTSRRQNRFVTNNFYDSNDLYFHLPTPITSNFSSENFSPVYDDVWNEEDLSRNFLRYSSESTINCYLCDVFFIYTPSSIQQHINGRRHRELYSTSRPDTINNETLDDIPPEENAFDNRSLVPFSWSTRSRFFSSSLPPFLGIQDNNRIERASEASISMEDQNQNGIFSLPIATISTSTTSAPTTSTSVSLVSTTNMENNRNNNEFTSNSLNRDILNFENRIQQLVSQYDQNLPHRSNTLNRPNNEQNNIAYYNRALFNYNNRHNFSTNISNINTLRNDTNPNTSNFNNNSYGQRNNRNNRHNRNTRNNQIINQHSRGNRRNCNTR